MASWIGRQVTCASSILTCEAERVLVGCNGASDIRLGQNVVTGAAALPEPRAKCGCIIEDDEVNAIVLTGAGRAFSAGGDIKGMQARIEDPSLPRIHMSNAYRLINNVLNVEKPIIAAVNGHAIGLGATVALVCDVVFATESARIGDPHVNVGLVAGDGGCVIWPLLSGVARAKQYLLTGDPIDAKEAERIGLVNKALHKEVLPAAMAFPQRLANGPTKAIGWTKLSINQYLKQGMNTILQTSLATVFLSFQTADHAEAVNAFVEKRTPRFTGK